MSKKITLFLIIWMIGISHASSHDGFFNNRCYGYSSDVYASQEQSKDIINQYLNLPLTNMTEISFQQQCSKLDEEFFNISEENEVEAVNLVQIDILKNLIVDIDSKKPKDFKDKKSKSEPWKIRYLNNMNLPDDIAIYDALGKEHYLDEFESKTILVVFWATWSTSCVNDLIALDELKKDFRKLPFEVIPISVDYLDNKTIDEYFKKHNIRHINSYHDRNNKLFKAFSVVGLPTSFLISFDGEVIASLQGNVNWYNDSIRELIFSYIQTDFALPKNSYQDKSLNYSIRNIDKSLKNSKIIDVNIPVIKDNKQNLENSKEPIKDGNTSNIKKTN
jgi:thiol-disulfide isomerase/thioredoxin